MREKKSALLLGTAALAIATGWSVDAWAQRRAAEAFEEIIITAQKREESLQSVPIAVTALDAAAIEKSFARDIQDVENLAPNLIIDPILGNGTAAISIRGMQLNDVEKSFDPAVAVYVDGIYLANTTGALVNIWDAESVEVLRGPQGTLFGRNTIGGLLHVKRAKPTGELGGKLNVTYGRFEQFDAKGVLNLPSAGDKLAAKVAFAYMSGGGYFKNIVRNRDEGDTDFLMLSGAALWTPSDSFELHLIYDYIDDKTDTRPVTSLTSASELFCGVFGTGCGQPASNEKYHRTTRTTLKQDAFLETHAITANMKWQIADNHSLQSVIGWRTVDEDAIQEFDGVTAELFWTNRPQSSDQLSVELRWHGDWSERVKSVLGVYYWDSDYTLQQVTHFPAFFGTTTSDNIFKQDTKSYAVFGQVDAELIDNLTFSVGGRWIDEKKKACLSQFLTLANGTVIDGAKFGSQSAFSACDPANPLYVPSYVDPASGQTILQDGEDSWSEFTPRLNLTYAFDNGIVFVTYSEGFRSGGFNGRGTNAFTLGPYEPEKVKNWEFGTKTDWADNRLQVNATVFFTDYGNKQEDVVFPDPIAVTQTVVQNAASASINGVELELRAIPTTGLTLGLNVGYMDAKYDSWTVTGLDGNQVDKSDFKLRRAPKWTIGANGLYEHELGNGHFLVFSANYTWRDDYYITANTITTQNPNAGLNKSHGILDASINYEAEHWRLSVFGKNLTNEDYFLHVLDVGTNYVATSPTNATPVPVAGLWTFGTINPPRTWGVELEFKF